MTARSLTSHNNPNAPAESFDVRGLHRQEADAYPVQPYSTIVILGVWLCGAALSLAVVFKFAALCQALVHSLSALSTWSLALAIMFALTGLVTCVTSPRREC